MAFARQMIYLFISFFTMKYYLDITIVIEMNFYIQWAYVQISTICNGSLVIFMMDFMIKSGYIRIGNRLTKVTLCLDTYLYGLKNSYVIS